MKCAFIAAFLALLAITSSASNPFDDGMIDFLKAKIDEDPSLQIGPLIDGFRPPAVPLVVFDPFMSIWSMSDNLYDEFPTLWCGPIKALTGAIRVDGKAFRFMGPGSSGGGIPADDVISQTSVKVAPTQTFYTFDNDQITLVVRFSTPTIPTDLDMLSKPITYISFQVTAKDGQAHQIEIYYDQTAEIAVNSADEEVGWSRVPTETDDGTAIMKLGTTAQNILGKSGDCDAINWGYAYVAVTPVTGDNLSTVINGASSTRSQFVTAGTIPSQDDSRQPRKANDDWPVMAVSWSFVLSPEKSQSRYLVFAYDDLESINYFGTQLPAYWRRNGDTPVTLIVNATRDFDQTLGKLDSYDRNLLDALSASASPYYATVASLVFRQTFGGCKLVWNAAQSIPWYFMKEISSDGDLSTVDVVFPASPLLLYANPYLMELLLLPLLAYANNETNIVYNLTWAPHHLGTWPIGNLRPDQQEQMPVEETGNLLMIIAALVSYSQTQGKDYSSLMFPKYANLIQSWADYLTSGAGVLPDPGDQLCTDDFLGPSPHNTNLALKGIVGLGCYARICAIQNRSSDATKYMTIAEQYADYWVKNAIDGDHYRLQYDLPNTWSLKYNMLYQYIVGVNLFSASVMQTEIAYYMGEGRLNTYGVPLNNEKTFTKLDWLSWIAAMASNKNDRLNLFQRIYDFANETPNRVPLTDWYDTVTGHQSGFQARPVLGGVYAWILLHSNPVVADLAEL